MRGIEGRLRRLEQTTQECTCYRNPQGNRLFVVPNERDPARMAEGLQIQEQWSRCPAAHDGEPVLVIVRRFSAMERGQSPPNGGRQ